MQLHTRFRNPNVLLWQLRALLHNAVEKNEYPSGVSKIENSQLVFPLLRPQLPQLAANLRRVRKRQIRPFLLQHLDQRQGFGPVLDRQGCQILFHGRVAALINEEINLPWHLL
jgi:hypothetical protein